MASSVGGVNVPITGNSSGFKKAMAGAQAATKKFGASTVALNRKLKKVGKSMTKLGKTTFMGLTAPIAAFGVAAVKSFEEQIAAEKRLENAVGGAATALKAQAAELQKVTRFGDEATMAVQGQLATLGLTEDQILRLTPLVQDLSARTGKDLAKSAKEVTSALSTGSTTLAKYGVELTSSNTMAENFELTMVGLTKTVGGQAQVLANEGVGPLVMMQNAMGDLMEQFGEIIVVAIKPFVIWIKDLAIRFQELSPETKKIIVIVAALVAGIGPLLLVLGTLTSIVLPAIITGFAALTAPIGLAVLAIGIAVFEIQRNWDDIVDYFTTGPAAESLHEFKELWDKIFSSLPDSIGGPSDKLIKIWDIFVASFVRPIKMALDTIFRIIKKTLGIIGDVIDIITAAIAGDWATVWNEMKSILIRVFSSMVDGVTSGLTAMLGAIGGVVGFFDKEWGGSIENAQKAVNSFGNDLVEKASDFIGFKKEARSATDAVDKLAESLDEVTTPDPPPPPPPPPPPGGKGEIIDPFKGMNEGGETSKATTDLMMYQAALAETEAISAAVSERLAAQSQAVVDSVGGAFQGFTNTMIESMKLADSGMEGFFKNIMAMGVKLISLLIKNAIKNIAIRQAESVANSVAGATSSGAATGPAAVFTTPAFIATAIGGVLAAFAAIPKFAKGGLVTGATLGMIGEGRGTTASNPEVIAPLDKLKGMMGGGRVEFIIEGDKLRGVLANTNSNSSFTSPTTVFS